MDNRLATVLLENETWLMERVVDYAKRHDYARHTSTLVDAWRASIAGITQALLAALRGGEPIAPLGADDDFGSTSLDRFSRMAVQRHRARGVTLGMFLGLLKYYRASYLDLVRRAGFAPAEEDHALRQLERFFDRFEIAYSVEWNTLSSPEKVQELQELNRRMTDEKNKYLTIFESLYDPVILLDKDGLIENVNRAAAELFQRSNLQGPRYYDREPGARELPWLRDEVRRFMAGEEQEVVLDAGLVTAQGARPYQVKLKRMLDISGKYPGTVLILSDLTERREKEEALVLSREIESWVNTLVEIGRRISRMKDVEDVLPLLARSVTSLLSAPFAAVGLWQEERRCLSARYVITSQGEQSATDFPCRCPPDVEECTEVSSAGCLERIGWELYGRRPGERPPAWLALPLTLDDRMVGALWAAREQPFGSSESVVLESLADQAAIAIEQASLSAKIRSLAVVEERGRIAREMHDGLAQILAYLNLEMQSLEALVRQHRLDDTLESLRLARERIREAQAEVRDNILTLRTALAKGKRALPAIEQLLREFGLQTGVRVHLAGGSGADPPLESVAEVQLVRTVQEALANVRLHAQASNVWLRVREDEGRLHLELRDDGVGFGPAALPRFGLDSMRERMASVGGSFSISSTPGEGTLLRVVVPLEAAGARARAS